MSSGSPGLRFFFFYAQRPRSKNSFDVGHHRVSKTNSTVINNNRITENSRYPQCLPTYNNAKRNIAKYFHCVPEEKSLNLVLLLLLGGVTYILPDVWIFENLFCFIKSLPIVLFPLEFKTHYTKPSAFSRNGFCLH